MLVTSRPVSLEQVSSASSPSQMKFISPPMLLIISIFFWRGNHAVAVWCGKQGAQKDGIRWDQDISTGKCVASWDKGLHIAGTKYKVGDIINLNLGEVPTGQYIVNADSDFIGNGVGKWRIKRIKETTGGSTQFADARHDPVRTIVELTDKVVSKALYGVAKVSGARVSGYNRFDDYSAYDGDYSAYSEYDGVYSTSH